VNAFTKRHQNIVILLLFGILFLSGGAIHADSTDASSLIDALRFDTDLEFCGEKVPLENQEVRERFEKDMLLSLWDRPQVILWLKRANRYLPIIEKALKEAGLPDDLKYISLAESALRPHVGSRKGAVGYWQFTAATARNFGLTVNRHVDERRNIVTATAAAIRYLKKLHLDYGSWTLAAAAYNMGEGGLTAEILEQGTKDYYQLYLPLETQRYVFRILSVKLILTDPEKYGFKLKQSELYPPREFDSIQVQCADEVPIRLVAQAANTYFKVIKDLNPHIRGHYLSGGDHTILIPKGASTVIIERFQDLVDTYQATQKEQIYIVKKGDNLSLIADRFGVPLAALIIWNRIDIRKPIHPGDRLVVYRQTEESE
jgi:LysM repeat protein